MHTYCWLNNAYASSNLSFKMFFFLFQPDCTPWLSLSALFDGVRPSPENSRHWDPKRSAAIVSFIVMCLFVFRCTSRMPLDVSTAFLISDMFAFHFSSCWLSAMCCWTLFSNSSTDTPLMLISPLRIPGTLSFIYLAVHDRSTGTVCSKGRRNGDEASWII